MKAVTFYFYDILCLYRFVLAFLQFMVDLNRVQILYIEFELQNGGRTHNLEEKLTQLIRKTFQEEIKKQGVHITNIIYSNFKITMEEFKKSQEQIKKLKKEVTELKSSVEHTDADLNELSNRVDEICDYQVDPEYVINKLIGL